MSGYARSLGGALSWYLFQGAGPVDVPRDVRSISRALTFGLACPGMLLLEPDIRTSGSRTSFRESPKELEDRGVSIQVAALSPSWWLWVRSWEGKRVTSKGEPSANLDAESMAGLSKRPELSVLAHEEGRVLPKNSGVRDGGTPLHIAA